jgi:DNA-binding transcriptional LysR family regulator
MMDRLDAMEVFLAAVDGGSLSSAGRKLGIPLTTVSRKISDLERHLTVRLLERSTRKIMPTDAGCDFAAACKGVLQSVREAERAAAGEYETPRGALTVCAPLCFGRLHVLPVVSEFLQHFPDVDVRLMLTDRDVALQEERVDLAVRIANLPDSSLIGKRIAQVRPIVCASPRYLERAGRPAHPRELANHACITAGDSSTPRGWTFQIEGAEVRIPVKSRLVATTSEAAIDAAVDDLGLTQALGCQASPACASGQLEIVLTGFEPRALPVSFVYRRRDRVPLKLRSFLDFAGPRLRQRLADSTVPFHGKLSRTIGI